MFFFFIFFISPETLEIDTQIKKKILITRRAVDNHPLVQSINVINVIDINILLLFFFF